MPVVEIYSPEAPPEPDLPRMVARAVGDALKIPKERVVVLWQQVDVRRCYRAGWPVKSGLHPPTVLVSHHASHDPDRVQAMLHAIRGTLAAALGCSAPAVFVATRHVPLGQVLPIELIDHHP